MLVWPTQVYLQQQLCLVQLQGDVVSLLAFPMQNHTIALRGLEPQRDHVFDDLHLLHLHRRESLRLIIRLKVRERAGLGQDIKRGKV